MCSATLIDWLRKIRAGENIEEEIKCEIVCLEARNTVFDWVNHPEYIGVGEVIEGADFISGKKVLSGIATYRDHVEQVVVALD